MQLRKNAGPAEGVPEVAGQKRSDGQHPSERDELEERDDAASQLLVVRSLGGDEAEGGRDRGGQWNYPPEGE